MSVAFDISRTMNNSGIPSRSWVPPRAVSNAATDGDDLAALQRVGMKLHFSRGETIFSEGEEANYSYKVVSGALRLCKHLVDGRRQIADFVLPGEFCGFLHLEAHRFTAEAASDVVLIAYPQRQIEALAETMPSMRRRLTRFLASRLARVQDHLVMLGRQTAKERVVSLLLTLADRQGIGEGKTLPLQMSRQDMADYLGLTIETVCRVLTELKRASLIGLPGLHEAVLKHLEALHDIVDGDE